MDEFVKDYLQQVKDSGLDKVIKCWLSTDEVKEMQNSELGSVMNADVSSIVRLYLGPTACLEQFELVQVELGPLNCRTLAQIHALDDEFDTDFFTNGLNHGIGGSQKWTTLLYLTLFETIAADIKDSSNLDGFATFEQRYSESEIQGLLEVANDDEMLPLHFAFAMFRECERTPDYDYLKYLLPIGKCQRLGKRALCFKGEDKRAFEFVRELYHDSDGNSKLFAALTVARRIERLARSLQRCTERGEIV